jgi:type I restriction enzyme, S subunit
MREGQKSEVRSQKSEPGKEPDSEILALPKGWVQAKLGHVCSFEYGKALKNDLRKQEGEYPVMGSNGQVGFHNEFLVNGPGVVIGRKGAAGEVSYIATSYWPIDTTYYLKLNCDSSLSYFYYVLKFLRLSRFEKSTAIPGLNRNDAYDQPIGIPPLAEQHRIVAKIEELFSSLDKGIEDLKTAQQQLRVYRQAVLKWAFEGKLTNKNVVDGDLPKGWKKVLLGSVIEQPRYGTSRKCGYYFKGKGVLRIPNIADGIIDDSDLKYAEFNRDETETYGLKAGDLLTIRSNGSVDLVGRCARVTERDEAYLFAGYLIRLRPLEGGILSKYLLHVLSSSDVRSQIETKAKSTSGVNNINSEELKSLVISVCTVAEQHTIVSEVESRLSVCDKIEETITNALKQAESLRQSILKKAFEGKLVPQDLHDEPASVLLARIKAERESNKAEIPRPRQLRKTTKTKAKS